MVLDSCLLLTRESQDPEGIGRMNQKLKFLASRFLAAMAALSLGVAPLQAQEKSPSRTPPQSAEVVLVRGPVTPAQLLRDVLGGFKATGEAREYNPDSLSELAGERAAAFREYRIATAASRPYGTTRVDVLQAENMFAAFGLFTYDAGMIGAKTSDKAVGFDSASASGQLIFWKDKYVVTLSDSSKRQVAAGQSQLLSLASSIAAALGNGKDAMRPPLLKSLPGDPGTRTSERYFMGPESLGSFVGGGREMFSFAGRAEAVLAEYAANGAQTPGAVSPVTQTNGSMKLLILECHTPQYATDALDRAAGYLESLPQDQKQRTILKREGNFIVEATGFDDRESAQQLVDSVKYEYTVKWLRDPLLPTNDPWRGQKTAQLLLSTFGLLGLMIISVLFVGGAVGSLVFLKRRKRQMEIFSDAGGMLRLELDPFEKAILGLPAASSREE